MLRGDPSPAISADSDPKQPTLPELYGHYREAAYRHGEERYRLHPGGRSLDRNDPGDAKILRQLEELELQERGARGELLRLAERYVQEGKAVVVKDTWGSNITSQVAEKVGLDLEDLKREVKAANDTRQPFSINDYLQRQGFYYLAGADHVARTYFLKPGLPEIEDIKRLRAEYLKGESWVPRNL